MEAPLSRAHHHASNADDALAKGLLIPAAEEHYKAAEAFKVCIEQNTDDGNKRTMRMLHDQHIKSAQDLQRRINKLREEKKDPSLPQVYRSSSGDSSSPSSSTPPYKWSPSPASPLTQHYPPQQLYRHQMHPQGPRRMTDSQQTVDESFMVLGAQRSDPGDAFNQFWKIMEGMLDNLSQPVAFATAPLAFDLTDPEASPVRDTLAREGSLSSDTDADDPSALGQHTLGLDVDKDDLVDLGDLDTEVLVEDGELSESFCLIGSSSKSGDAANSSASLLQKENAALKAEIVAMRSKLTQTERVLQKRKERDQQLKDSIVLARHQAQRVMAASVIGGPGQRQGPAGGPPQAGIDLGSLAMVPPLIPPPPREKEVQLMRRVRELEDEIKFVRAENEKQKAMITKFRERWEKLKDSAKRKKEARAVASATSSPVGAIERIEEVPEFEGEGEGEAKAY